MVILPFDLEVDEDKQLSFSITGLTLEEAAAFTWTASENSPTINASGNLKPLESTSWMHLKLQQWMTLSRQERDLLYMSTVGTCTAGLVIRTLTGTITRRAHFLEKDTNSNMSSCIYHYITDLCSLLQIY